jgi:RNA polymerase I-specific transcription initiation factor RRN5
MDVDANNDSSRSGSEDELPSSSPVKPEAPSEDEYLLDDVALPIRRHSVSSAGSEYSPSSEEDRKSKKRRSSRCQANREEENHQSEDEAGSSRCSRKRHPSPSADEVARPLKRPRGVFNHDYLDLLNGDIRDAADRFVPNDGMDAKMELEPSQIGMTYWTAAEKEMFFEGLARLGSDKAVEIAARIKTKGELEAAWYLALLDKTAKEKKKGRELQHVVLADVPAAIELSPACCAALEEAADAISVRQEAYEEGEEKSRWGEEHWLITQENRKEIEKEAPEDMKGVRFFVVKDWLKLSERVFMNAAFEEYNWRSVSVERPAIRTTALDDIYSLAVSVTRRLVGATIYMCESSAAARSIDLGDSGIRREVRKQDVDAAVLSLGLPVNSAKFWAGCPRRIRLNVVDDENADADVLDGEEDLEPLSYSDVEETLGGAGYRGSTSERDADVSSSESDMVSLSDTPSIDGDDDEDSIKDEDALAGEEEDEEEGSRPMADVDEDEVQEEAKELLRFSALDYPNTTKAKRTLKARIRIAHAQESYANASDSRASYNEEKYLWDMLGKDPPEGFVKPESLEARPTAYSHPVDDLIYTRTTGGGGWRDSLGFVPSKWELEAQQLLGKQETDGKDRR